MKFQSSTTETVNLCNDNYLLIDYINTALFMGCVVGKLCINCPSNESNNQKQKETYCAHSKNNTQKNSWSHLFAVKHKRLDYCHSLVTEPPISNDMLKLAETQHLFQVKC